MLSIVSFKIMSKASKQRRKKHAARKTTRLVSPAGLSISCGEIKHREALSQQPTRHEPKQSPLDGVPGDLIKKPFTWIWGLFAFSWGGPLNFFGNKATIFYFPAITSCVLLTFLAWRLFYQNLVDRMRKFYFSAALVCIWAGVLF